MERHASGNALRLSGADFDAFLEPAAPLRGGNAAKAATHRRALRERIDAWAKNVMIRMSQLGLALDAVVPDELEQHLSSRAPRAIAQRALFVRDSFARTGMPNSGTESDPLQSYAYLALTIDSVHVEVSLEIAPEAEVDLKNLRARLADPTALLELLALFQTLPEEFAIGVIGVPSFPRVQSSTADDVRALLDDSQRNRRPLWIGWSVKREIALAHSNELDEELADALFVLAHVYKLLAWAPDNDLIAAGGRGAWRATRARAEERRERGREERRKRRGKIRKGPVRAEGSRREREDARRAFAIPERDAPVSRRPGAGEETRDSDNRIEVGSRAVPPRRPILQTTLRARGARPAITEIDPSAPIEKGTKVRVLAGPFMNKVGIVQEIDARGRARVRLGLLAATLETKDLAASTEGSRPLLGSSHRRPRSNREK